MKARSVLLVATNLLAIVFGLPTSLHAGPPLICHVIEIDQAKSLPWLDWNQKINPGYDTKNLTEDTLAILDGNTPVLVRMETLRRATLYARLDQRSAKELLTRLYARAQGPYTDAHAAALAWFDLGYLVSAYQEWIPRDQPNPANGLDGYGWVKKAIGFEGDNPQMEFAAALITFSFETTHHAAHVRKALAGAKDDRLLEKNLRAMFHGITTAQLLAQPSAGGLKK